MKRALIPALLTAFTLSAMALPGLDAVQSEIAKGHYTQAEDMMREVVAARPDSARAHYVYAEILAHDQRFARAADEAAQARRLDPALSFTQPEKFNAFSALLEREQAAGRSAAGGGAGRLHASPQVAWAPSAPVSSGVPAWAWAAGLALLAFGMWRLVGGRAAMPVGSLAPYNGVPAPAGGNGYAAPPMVAAPYGAPSMVAPSGHGLMATGLAVAGGVAAGMLAERLLDGHRSPMGLVPDAFDAPPPIDTAAQALEQRPIDMGTGAGWGGGETDIDTGTPSDDDTW
ncbi:hypothetical protein DBR42_03305 [Pelomonas sp. HMWF004]|nr:hypothetical protein DBR42_03305 [Pelomonas sp. HMWF004]